MVDRILYNGNIITLDAQQPRVSAMAIHHGRIYALGHDDDILALARPHTHRQNLGGRTLIPGLTDAHIHWEWLSRALQSVDLFEVPSKASAVERVQARANITPSGQWVTGRGWTQALWDGNEFPCASDLDPVTPHNPAFFPAKSGHAAWVNSAALRVCGITANTPDPEGGHIERDAHGQPTGLLLETAIELVQRHIPAPTPEQLADYMAHTQTLALASGLTGIHDFDNPSCLQALQVLRERGNLHLRVLKQVNQAWLEPTLAAGIRGGFGDEWLRFGALKLFADGALGPRTAYMMEAYENEPANFGMVVVDKETMYELISKASAHGLPSTVHAIGDRAVHDVLDVFAAVRQEEQARGETPSQRRHRIEHVQLIHHTDTRRLAELDLIASMQPIHATSDWQMSEAHWGQRSHLAYNARLQADLGVRLAFGSDSPVEPFEPLKGIYAAVTRQRPDGTPQGGWYPESRLSMDEALRGFTQGPAYAAYMEHQLGTLKAGYLADAVLFDRDITAIPADEILSLQVLGTMVQGVWRYGETD